MRPGPTGRCYLAPGSWHNTADPHVLTSCIPLMHFVEPRLDTILPTLITNLSTEELHFQESKTTQILPSPA